MSRFRFISSKRLTPLLSIVALPMALLVSTGAAAQRGPHHQRGGKHQGKVAKLSEQERKEMRAEVQRKVQTYVTLELSSMLGLDDATTLKLASVVKIQMAQRQEAQKAMKAETTKLKTLLEGNASDSKLRAQTQLVLVKAKAQRDPQPLYDATSRFLNVKQQAKMVLAYPHITREVRKMMQKQRRQMHRKHGQRGNR